MGCSTRLGPFLPSTSSDSSVSVARVIGPGHRRDRILSTSTSARIPQLDLSAWSRHMAPIE